MHVNLNGRFTDEEACSNLTIRKSLCEQCEDFNFTRRQVSDLCEWNVQARSAGECLISCSQNDRLKVRTNVNLRRENRENRRGGAVRTHEGMDAPGRDATSKPFKHSIRCAWRGKLPDAIRPSAELSCLG